MDGDRRPGDGEGRNAREDGAQGGEGRGSSSLASLAGGRNPSQMVICYDGSVRVFNRMTVEKVQAIILMAAAAEAAAAVPELTRTLSFESSTAEVDVARPSPPPHASQQQQSLLATDSSNPLCRLQAGPPYSKSIPSFTSILVPSLRRILHLANVPDLPIARRNSLQRFLEKRRERLVSKAPYLAEKMLENPSDGCSENEPSTPSSSFKEPDMSP